MLSFNTVFWVEFRSINYQDDLLLLLLVVVVVVVVSDHWKTNQKADFLWLFSAVWTKQPQLWIPGCDFPCSCLCTEFWIPTSQVHAYWTSFLLFSSFLIFQPGLSSRHHVKDTSCSPRSRCPVDTCLPENMTLPVQCCQQKAHC